MRIAVFPGSFDPMTLGHLDLIERAANLFDKVIVTVMSNINKNTVFTVEERIDFLKRATVRIKNVEVRAHDGLLANYVQEVGACAIVKGVRNGKDYENERDMALINRKLAPAVETVCLIARSKFTYVSSSMIRDIAAHGGCVDQFVPMAIKDEVQRRMRKDGH